MRVYKIYMCMHPKISKYDAAHGLLEHTPALSLYVFICTYMYIYPDASSASIACV